MEERRRTILAVDAEILLGAPTAKILVEREASARAFDRLMRYEATLQRSLNRRLAAFRSLKREAAKEAQADVAAEAAAQPAPTDAEDNLQNEANPAHTDDAAPSRSARPPGRRVGETPWYNHEEGFLQTKPIPRNPLKGRTIRSPDRSRWRPRPSSECCSHPSGAGRSDSIYFPQAPGARSARLATRVNARGAIASSGPSARPLRYLTPRGSRAAQRGRGAQSTRQVMRQSMAPALSRRA